jgi:RNase P subunit RPR2
MEMNEAIVKKIQKLLALADKARNNSEEEAQGDVQEAPKVEEKTEIPLPKVYNIKVFSKDDEYNIICAQNETIRFSAVADEFMRLHYLELVGLYPLCETCHSYKHSETGQHPFQQQSFSIRFFQSP